MSSAVIFMQWESYESETAQPVFFRQDPLTFNSRQQRLHKLCEGDRLWLVSRCPADQQYYFVAILTIAATQRSDPASPEAEFGEFGVIVERANSQDFGKRFPAEGLLRALEFESGKAIKYGASTPCKHCGFSVRTMNVFSTGNSNGSWQKAGPASTPLLACGRNVTECSRTTS